MSAACGIPCGRAALKQLLCRQLATRAARPTPNSTDAPPHKQQKNKNRRSPSAGGSDVVIVEPWQVQLSRLRTAPPGHYTVRKWNWALQAMATSEPTPPGAGSLAAQILKEMSQRGLEPDTFSYAQALSLCVGDQDARRALMFLRAVRGRANALCYNNAALACKRAGRVRAAAAVFSAMEADGIAPNSRTRVLQMQLGLEDAGPHMSGDPRASASAGEIVARMEGLAARADWTAVLHCYNELVESEARLSPKVICRALRACEQLGMADEAEKIVKQTAAPIPPKVFSLAIRAIGASGKWENALKLLHSIPSPNSLHYSEVMRILKWAKRWKEMVILLRTIPSELECGHHYGLAMSCLRGAGEHAQSLRLHEQMILRGARIQLPAHHEAMLAYMAADDVPAALALLENVVLKACEPTAATFAVATRCVSCSTDNWSPDPELALELVRSMREYGITPTDEVCANVVTAFGRAGRWVDAESALDRLRQEGVQAASSEVVKWALRRARAPLGDWREAISSLNDFIAEGRQPSANAWSAALVACVYGRRLDQAITLMNEMKSRWKCYPREGDYNAIIHAACEQNENTLVWALFDSMRTGKRGPTKRTYRRAIEGLHAAGNFDSVDALYASAVQEVDLHVWRRDDPRDAAYLDLRTFSTAVAQAAMRRVLNGLAGNIDALDGYEFSPDDDLVIHVGVGHWQQGERSAPASAAAHVLDAAGIKWAWQNAAKGRIVLPAEEIIRWQRIKTSRRSDRDWIP
jgi:hypothetical protein